MLFMNLDLRLCVGIVLICTEKTGLLHLKVTLLLLLNNIWLYIYLGIAILSNIRSRTEKKRVSFWCKWKYRENKEYDFQQIYKSYEVLFLYKTRRRVMEKTPMSRVSNCYFYNCCIPGNLLESEVNTEHL